MKLCHPHLARTGKKIPAVRDVDGTPMCRACFQGKPIELFEEREKLPSFLAEKLNEKTSANSGTRGPHRSHTLG
jgi:hypothetical protein